MEPEFARFFENYAAAFNRSLGEIVDDAGLTAAFAPSFIGASPAGVQAGANDEAFRAVLHQAYGFYRQIGTRHVEVAGIDVTPLDALHHMVRVHWSWKGRSKTGETTEVAFDVVYLLQTLEDGPRIFAFISGDEMAAFREHGVI
jgi:hypothetical protein